MKGRQAKNPLNSTIGGSAIIPIYGLPLKFSLSSVLKRPEDAKLYISIPFSIPILGNLKIISLDGKKIRRKVARAFGRKKKSKAKKRREKAEYEYYSKVIDYNYKVLEKIEDIPNHSIFEDGSVSYCSEGFRQCLDILNFSTIDFDIIQIDTIEDCQNRIQIYQESANALTDQLETLLETLETESNILNNCETMVSSLEDLGLSVNEEIDRNRWLINELNSVVSNLSAQT